MKKALLLLVAACGLSATALQAQRQPVSKQGGISPALLQRLRAAQSGDPAQKALQGALAANSINALAARPNNPDTRSTWFSNEVPSKGITDQKQSGRCWLFTGLNVMRSQMIREQKLGEFQFSQSYCWFYDQLEKANLFLQAVIDKAVLPMSDQTVDWLFRNPISDGGTFCGVQDIVGKYGLVPACVMPESYNANNTSKLSSILALKLREFGLAQRRAKASERQALKEKQLATIYRILALSLGEPPEQFEWTRTDDKGRPVETKTYTPRQFYQEFIGIDLASTYVMLMNDPSRPYNRTYTIDLDRHSYDGQQWTYLNVPMDVIKAAAAKSIKDSTMLYMSCDVGKFYNKESGVLSLQNYDYGSLFQTDFPMTKAERIQTYASASSHAMTLKAVDLRADGTYAKWMVENSWGPSAGHKGCLIMTDEWLDEYLFRLVVDRKYLPADVLKLTGQEPTLLPAWDPLFLADE
ncbi:MAG: C1 family peptidase [Bacteroidaceae bacterium]|nr:C1 family peptidase [Bacteroidaceae bacterium]